MKIRRAKESVSRPALMKSQEAQIRDAEFSRRVWDMKTNGWTIDAIAKKIGCDRKKVIGAWETGFADYIEDHKRVRDRKFAEVLAGHEKMIKQWSSLAKHDPEAARIVLRARHEIARMCGHGNSHHVEHTGAGGGPIMTVNATPMEAARAVRESFGGNIMPFNGRTVEALPAENDDGSEDDERTEH